jgi:hypothetical protein
LDFQVSTLIVTYCAATFKDYNLINHKLLQNICKQVTQKIDPLVPATVT